MQRREFSKRATAAAAAAAGAVVYAKRNKYVAPVTDTPTPTPTPAPTPAPTTDTTTTTPTTTTPDTTTTQPVASSGLAMGTNLSGMEWTRPSLRYGQSTMPNLNFTVPRQADVTYLAKTGFTKNRLPIQWELLQPMLSTTVANTAAKAAIGNPGELHAGYASYIQDVLDAHAAAGIKCIIDLHNYCRYQDFVYQADGSVIGLTKPADPLIRPYTTDANQVQERIFSLAAGSRLTIAAYTDFWTRVATKWKDHPGLGGYGLMNEPHDLPVAGGTVASTGGEDLTIWPTFAQAAINAIRAVDANTAIYLSGNEWDAAMTIGTMNPKWPLAGTNLIYEVHMYLDAYSNGWAFDWDTEVAKGYSVGEGGVPISTSTGYNRLKIATDWAKAKGVKLALTEVGMPIDDPRWQQSFAKAMELARQEGVEVYSWMGGNHWPIHNYPINHVPGWHQNKTLEPLVSGAMKVGTASTGATLFDDGPGYASSGTSVTITVYARGYLASPVTISVASSNGGTLSKSTLTIPAGANGQDSYTFTSPSNAVTTLTYSGAAQVPPPRKVYSLTDPVAYASTSLTDAAMAIIAKYNACKWEMADGYTDYMQGVPAADGQPVRAIADSGYGSTPGNAMEMINWINKENPNNGTMSVPVMRTTNGKKNTDHTVYNTFGFWCKKSDPQAGVQPNPVNRIPYHQGDAHFAIAAVSVPDTWNTGVVFQASKTEEGYSSELLFSNSQPQAKWIDKNNQTVTLTSSARLAANTPSVISFTSVPGAQRLRVNAAVVGSASATLAPSVFNQMMIGWGYCWYYPRDGFMGNIYSVISGKGAPTTAEMSVLERYLGTTAGVSF
ncbi:cellulase family glycosylhydrolase [Ramlibacter sp.]|uniref:cellulase family glycosylhydrolase n=1 Tax=Ramlibacter sp. TaxID=1917967 RepID=UPI002D0FA650|nr:cellulase family glycosylhydrolase [Ramlibacter sp.]HWI82287.1 cellulase family glycosylhydrolase [Ramlibacter sp.]